MVFVTLFDAHHTLRSTLFTRDPPPRAGSTTLDLHETSEYELYDTYAFYQDRLHRKHELGGGRRRRGGEGHGQPDERRQGHHPLWRTTADGPLGRSGAAAGAASSQGGASRSPPPQGAAVARRRLRFADMATCCVDGQGRAVAECDVERMHDELATTYGLDFIACHSSMRRVRE